MVIDGYVRVSQVGGRGGQSFISPVVQREQIEAWALANGSRIAQVFEELDESGARADRPLLAAAIERVEHGETQGIVVAKLDRFGRSLVDGLSKIDRIAAAGGIFVSVQDGLDLSTPTGKLVLRIMFSMAEWELDRVRANWNTARAKAIARGVPLTSPPLGYKREDSGCLTVDPQAATVVAELFRRRGDGATLVSLIGFLNASGLHPVRGGSEFVETSVRGILANRTYLGELRSGSHFNPEAHEAIIDEVTWQLAQRPVKFQSNRRTSLLGGLLRCSSCRMKMSVEAGVYPHGGTRGGAYRCPGRTSAGACPAPARVRGEEIEALVEEFVIRASRPKPTTRADRDSLARAERILVEAEEAFARYRDTSGAVTVLTPQNFAAGLANRQADVEEAAVAVASARRRVEVFSSQESDLEARWPELSVAERRGEIEERIDCIFIEPGESSGIERAHVCARGTEPGELPRRGVGLGRLHPIEPSRFKGMRRLRPAARWAPRRIEEELRRWREGRSEWPSYPEFIQAGQTRLHLQVLQYGGPHYWAHRLSWRRPQRVPAWTPEVIEGALRPIVAGRSEWPSAAEFAAVGLSPARRAVIRHGGIALWCLAMGLSPRSRTALTNS